MTVVVHSEDLYTFPVFLFCIGFVQLDAFEFYLNIFTELIEFIETIFVRDGTQTCNLLCKVL